MRKIKKPNFSGFILWWCVKQVPCSRCAPSTMKVLFALLIFFFFLLQKGSNEGNERVHLSATVT